MAPAITAEKVDHAVEEWEPRPPRGKKGKKKTRLAVSIRKGKLCFIPATATESGEEAPARSGSETPERSRSGASS
jgi:hypothetical protein